MRYKVDWQAQWEAHGFNFHDGHVHLEVPHAVSSPWQKLRLMPGAGFGDLSHHTTRLVKQMMGEDIRDQTVVDIGCGSGVLGIYALALGAKFVFAIDIDEQALEHTQKNAVLNNMQNKMSFHLPHEFQLPLQANSPFILMNMIQSEQQEAWNSLKSLHYKQGICIISGILAEQKQAYLKMVKEWGWQLLEEREEKGWLGIRFTR